VEIHEESSEKNVEIAQKSLTTYVHRTACVAESFLWKSLSGDERESSAGQKNSQEDKHNAVERRNQQPRRQLPRRQQPRSQQPEDSSQEDSQEEVTFFWVSTTG